MHIFPESSFFKEQRAPALPTPVEIRALNEPLHYYGARQPPVVIPSLKLCVKYGAHVTIAEIYTQKVVCEKLQGQVPVPEVFGWADDDGERFHYMSLVNGETLLVRWSSMNDNERRAVCNELKHMAKQWRALSQDGPDPYIGSLGRQPLSDIFLGYLPEYAGPFQGANVVQQFHEVCGLKSTMTCPLYSRMLILSHPTFFYAGPGSEGGSGY